MRWFIKLESEEEKVIKVAYSYLEDLCDGIIIYDKDSGLLSIEKYSSTANDFETKWGFQFIYRLIRKKELSTKIRCICTG